MASKVHWEPRFGTVDEDGFPKAWRVNDGTLSYYFDDRDCAFASKRDCELACKALNDAGLTGEDVMAMTDEEFGKIVVSNLRWQCTGNTNREAREMSWKLKRTKQCAKCPWRKDVDPHTIPNGYCEDKHRALKSTIAMEGDLSTVFSGEQRVMACHETQDAHCIGWLANQLGPGNNIGLRMRMLDCENGGAIKLVGEQHETFEETLP